MKTIAVVSKDIFSFLLWKTETFGEVKNSHAQAKFVLDDTLYLCIYLPYHVKGYVVDEVIELDTARENLQYDSIMESVRFAMKFHQKKNNTESLDELSDDELTALLKKGLAIVKNIKEDMKEDPNWNDSPEQVEEKSYSQMSDEELRENNIVKINDEEIIWNIEPSISPRKNGDESLIRLSWGMFTPYHVDTNASMARQLIAELTELVEEIEKNSKK
jgi:hypothetical protein